MTDGKLNSHCCLLVFCGAPIDHLLRVLEWLDGHKNSLVNVVLDDTDVLLTIRRRLCRLVANVAVDDSIMHVLLEHYQNKLNFDLTELSMESIKMCLDMGGQIYWRYLKYVSEMFLPLHLVHHLLKDNDHADEFQGLFDKMYDCCRRGTPLENMVRMWPNGRVMVEDKCFRRGISSTCRS